jgi:hypothetical protein
VVMKKVVFLSQDNVTWTRKKSSLIGGSLCPSKTVLLHGFATNSVLIKDKRCE